MITPGIIYFIGYNETLEEMWGKMVRLDSLSIITPMMNDYCIYVNRGHFVRLCSCKSRQNLKILKIILSVLWVLYLAPIPSATVFTLPWFRPSILNGIEHDAEQGRNDKSRKNNRQGNNTQQDSFPTHIKSLLFNFSNFHFNYLSKDVKRLQHGYYAF